MPFNRLQEIIKYYTNNFIFKNIKFTFAIFMGLLLPDIDNIIALFCSLFIGIEKSLLLLTNKITHTFLTIIIIYFLGLIYYELTQKNNVKKIINGLIIGIILHLIVDVAISNQNIFILWPLNLKFNLISNYNYSMVQVGFLHVLDFLFFRFYGWLIVKTILLNPLNGVFYIKLIRKWMKIEFYFFIIMLLLFLLKFEYLSFLWLILFCPSIIIAILLTYMIINKIV